MFNCKFSERIIHVARTSQVLKFMCVFSACRIRAEFLLLKGMCKEGSRSSHSGALNSQLRKIVTSSGQFFPSVLVIGLKKGWSTLWRCLSLPFVYIGNLKKKPNSDLIAYFGWHESYPLSFWLHCFKCLKVSVIVLSLLFTELTKTTGGWTGKCLLKCCISQDVVYQICCMILPISLSVVFFF